MREATAPVSPRYRWYVVAILWAICFFSYADRQAIFSVFPLLEKDMGLSPVQLGLLGSSFAWVYGLAAPLAGYLVDRVQRRTAILAGLHLWSVTCAATAVSANFLHLFLFRAALGLGETVYYPAYMSMVSDYHGKTTRSKAMGISQTGIYVGTIAGGAFAGLIAQYYGWRSSFLVFGALGVVYALFLQRVLIEPKRGAADLADAGAPGTRELAARLSAGQVLRTLLRTPSALLLAATFVCANFVGVVLYSWMPKFLYDKFHMSLAAAGLAATAFAQLASMIGSPLGGVAADWLQRRTRRGRAIVQLAGVLSGVPFVILCATTESVAWLVVALTAWGLCKGIYDANIWASLFDVIPPEARGSAVGLMNAAGWLLGGGAAPVTIGIIAAARGLSAAIAFASLVYFGAAALLLTAIVFFVDRDAARVQASIERTAAGLR